MFTLENKSTYSWHNIIPPGRKFPMVNPLQSKYSYSQTLNESAIIKEYVSRRFETSLLPWLDKSGQMFNTKLSHFYKHVGFSSCLIFNEITGFLFNRIDFL